MSSKAARTLATLLRPAALVPRAGARLLARLLVVTTVAALIAPAATYALDPSTSTVVSSAASALAGGPVTYTVRVTAPTGSPVPTGTVTVRDGATPIGTCVLASGTCTVVSSSLSVGMHAITAAYPGDAAHDPSTSPVALQAITAGIRAARTAATTVSSGQTSLVVTAPVGATTGDVLVAALAVTGGTGTTITASGWTRLAGSDLSSGTVLRQGLFYRVRTATDPSTFTFTFSSAQKASAVMVAVAGADPVGTVRSAGATFASATAFTLPSISFGTRVTGVALGFLGVGVGTTIASVANGYASVGSIAATGGKAATQTTSGGGQLALAEATAATGARFTTGAAGVGIGHTVVIPTAPAATVTRIVTAPTAATFGTGTTWTARVDPTTATGSIDFLVDGVRATGCVVAAGSCSATLSLGAGQRTVSARFVPTPTSLLTSSSPSVSLLVDRAISTTTIAALAPTTTRGSVATFRVTVSGGATPTAGTGKVSILEAGQEVASCTLAAGQCDATTATLPVGAHTLGASFDGDANLQPSSSGAVTQTVTRAPSTTTLAVSPVSAAFGSPVTLTATVASAGGTPTGLVSFFDGATALPGCNLGNGGTPGACSITLTTLSIGAHSFVARYAGDADRLESTSGTQAATVAKASSALTVTSTPASPALGQTVTIRASVTTGDGTPATGTVTFTEGTVVIGSCTLGTIASGACSIDVGSFTIGTHVIGASYPGDTLRQPSTGSTTLTLGRAVTTTTMTSSVNPTTFGASTTFSIVTSSLAGVPTGSVAVSDGTTPLGSCPLVNGTCSLPVASLGVGPHTIVATYLGDTLRAPASTSLTQTVNRAGTATTLAVAGTLVVGSPVTLTATVDRSAATGTVTFTDGTTVLGTCTLGVGGIAGRCSLVTSSLAAGTRSIVAAYAGDASFIGSASNAATPTVARASTALSLAAAGPTSYGSTIVYTATLDRTAATGTISFSDGTTGIGSCTVGALAPGSCSISVSTLAVGAHTVTARYEGDASYLPTTSVGVVTTITRGASTTTIAASATSVVVDEPVTVTVSVSPATATGTADILDGTTWLGQCTVTGGSCTFTTGFPTRGTRSIAASYRGDTNLATSTSASVGVLVRAASGTSLIADVASSTYGQPVTLTASVAVTDGGTPTGRISFSDGTAGIGACDLAGAPSCAITVGSITAGVRSLVARYAGDTAYAPSSGGTSLTVVEATSSTTITSNAASAVALTPVTFSVAVATADGGPATGTVAVSDGTAAIGTCVLAAGTCSVTTSALVVGARTIVATYLGDRNHTGSSGSMTQTITAIPTTTTATPSATTITWGNAVTFVVTVAPSAATGTVTFSESNTTYGSCTILAANPGTCSFTTTALPSGNRSVSVRYGGDTRYGASTTTVAIAVNRATTSTTVTSSAATATYGSVVTFTATVSPASATGTVSFSDGTAGIGTCSITANGTCSITSSTLTVGTHSIVASYAGTTNLSPSVSTALAQLVTAAPTTLTLTTSANPSTAGAGTATVAISPAAATGTVALVDGSTPVGSCTLVSGTCSISIAGLSLGSHALTASYAGAANYGPSSASMVQVVSIGFRTVGAATSGSQTPTSLGIAIPAGVTTGDVIVAAVTIGSATATITPSAAWTRLGTDVTSGSITQGLFWRVATSGDIGTTSTFAFSTGVKASIVLVAVGGASTSLPGAGTVAAQANGVATSIATPGLTLPASTRGMALIFGGIGTGTTVSSVGSGFLFPVGGEAASSGGKGLTTTAAAYSVVSTYGAVGTSSIVTAATTGAASVGHVVFLAERTAP